MGAALFRHRVVSLPAPWVAAYNPLQRQPASIDESVLLQRLYCVVRAGGGIATGRGQKW